LILLADQVVTWVHTPKPTLDLVGIVVGALMGAMFVSVVALLMGSALGAVFIARNRRREATAPAPGLGLLEAGRPFTPTP
jgi:hypothetical protein